MLNHSGLRHSKGFGPARGFTLIELIAVIVIIGALAATALPKFSNFQSEARVAVLSRTAAEVSGAARMAYYKCILVAGCYTSFLGTKFTAPSGTFGSLYFGWPTGQSRANLAHGIKDWISVSGFSIVEVNTGVAEFRLIQSTDPTTCLVRYTETATLGVPPQVTVVSTGC